MSDDTEAQQRATLFRHFLKNPWWAHSYLFRHRHAEASSPAHKQCIADIWDRDPHRNIEAFRGFGKSTLLEETVILRCGLRLHHNFVIFGASERRAVERLEAVKTEITVNEFIVGAFGSLRGDIWQETKIVLSNGVCVQAIGRDQSLAGIKFRDWRPDGVLVDDLEDVDEIRTDMDRVRTWNWFLKSMIPSLDRPTDSWVRVLGTRRGSGSLPERLEASGWPTSKFPIEAINERGERQATWPAKFPLAKIDELKELYRGDLHTYEQEFMCRATSDRARLFQKERFRYEPSRPSWHAVYVFYDPARTKTAGSATTGKAVWSWVGNRLVVWECAGHFWSPDELVADIVRTTGEYGPVWVGVEKTGLNDWLMQPLRHEMLRQGILIPLLGVEAPRGKLDFIGALQPLFQGGEVIFAGLPQEFKGLEDQLLSFPRGRIDAPNALAYARTLRPGAPVYDNFADGHIARSLAAHHDTPLYLAANTDGSIVAGLLVQRRGNGLAVLADWVREGSPREVVGELAGDVALAHGGTTLTEHPLYGTGSDLFKVPVWQSRVAATEIKWIVPPAHFNEWNNHGLVQAIRSLPQPCGMGGEVSGGRDKLSQMLDQVHGGERSVLISENARWCLRALSGGYARAMGGRGLAEVQAQNGLYRVLMEALESFVGAGINDQAATMSGPDAGLSAAQPLAYTRSGVAYRSAIPDRGR